MQSVLPTRVGKGAAQEVKQAVRRAADENQLAVTAKRYNPGAAPQELGDVRVLEAQ
jgi:hypothetical protein